MTYRIATIFPFLGSGWLTCIRPLPLMGNFKLVIVDHFGTMPISTGTGCSIPKQPQPYHGHYFKVLKGQVPAALLGQMDFVVKGAMIGGFVLAAAAAEYRVKASVVVNCQAGFVLPI